MHLKRCYNIRKKIYSNKRVQDVERIATLLVFLHRKIELQIVNFKTSYEKGGLKLLTKIGNELERTLQGKHPEAPEEESFSFLKHLDGPDSGVVYDEDEQDRASSQSAVSSARHRNRPHN